MNAAVIAEVINGPADGVKAEGIPRVKSAGTLGDYGGGAADLTLRFAAKTAGLVLSVNLISEHAAGIPRLVLEYIYGEQTKHSCRHFASGAAAMQALKFMLQLTLWCDTAAVALYCFLGFVMDGPASLFTSAIKLNIAPHFNEPYLSESLTSFWGKRWNLTISNCLRGPVYDPIYEGKIHCSYLLLFLHSVFEQNLVHIKRSM